MGSFGSFATDEKGILTRLSFCCIFCRRFFDTILNDVYRWFDFVEARKCYAFILYAKHNDVWIEIEISTRRAASRRNVINQLTAWLLLINYVSVNVWGWRKCLGKCSRYSLQWNELNDYCLFYSLFESKLQFLKLTNAGQSSCIFANFFVVKYCNCNRTQAYLHQQDHSSKALSGPKLQKVEMILNAKKF